MVIREEGVDGLVVAVGADLPAVAVVTAARMQSAPPERVLSALKAWYAAMETRSVTSMTRLDARLAAAVGAWLYVKPPSLPERGQLHPEPCAVTSILLTPAAEGWAAMYTITDVNLYPVVSKPNDTAVLHLDWTEANQYSVTLTTDCELTFVSSAAHRYPKILRFTQDAVGGHKVTWPFNVTWGTP